MVTKLQNPVLISIMNKSCPTTATASDPTLMIDEDIGSSYGSDIYSLSFSFSSNFVQNYSYKMEIDGVQIGSASYPNNFQSPDATTPSFDYVKQDTVIPVPAGARLRIYAYNSNSATAAGTFSLYIYKDDKKSKEVF